MLWGSPGSVRCRAWPDPRLRFSVNLYGAPALSLPEFANYKQDLIIGASLQVSAPLGQYDADKVVNIGTNRWFFKPESLNLRQSVGESPRPPLLQNRA